MKKNILSLIVLFGVLMSVFMTAHAIEPRYVAITSLSSTLNISSAGAAECTGNVEMWDGYTADLKVELKRDGTTIKTWTDSGSGEVSAGGTYYVTSGHDYIVVTTATVYNRSGRWIESPTCDSDKQHY